MNESLHNQREAYSEHTHKHICNAHVRKKVIVAVPTHGLMCSQRVPFLQRLLVLVFLNFIGPEKFFVTGLDIQRTICSDTHG